MKGGHNTLVYWKEASRRGRANSNRGAIRRCGREMGWSRVASMGPKDIVGCALLRSSADVWDSQTLRGMVLSWARDGQASIQTSLWHIKPVLTGFAENCRIKIQIPNFMNKNRLNDRFDRLADRFLTINRLLFKLNGFLGRFFLFTASFFQFTIFKISQILIFF
jgi:hypothetical protein